MDKKKHVLYSTWKNMMARCYVKSYPNYKYYGAKKVTVSEQWHSFNNFIYDVDNFMPNGHLLYFQMKQGFYPIIFYNPSRVALK
ncbi:hypothetical protein [Bacillus cereus group sp. BfR-BA-01312]|uniref:hypothetical protein n=1 Tax=Bacillus cereus group sp. BfR-BA-01312 TaxID=2920289 RepID=UPI001F59F791|nr:hypothetical protein [Bacillus cereus group sp. BfR-BA-01312]